MKTYKKHNEAENQKFLHCLFFGKNGLVNSMGLLTLLFILLSFPLKVMAHSVGTCDEAIEGSFLYDWKNKAFIGCDGNEWILLGQSSDGKDSYAKLLLHFEGGDGATTFNDDSSSSHTITVNGDTQIDATKSFFGGASGKFDGTGDYLTAADSADWNFGSDDFTIDLWYNVDIPDNDYQYLISTGYSLSSGTYWGLRVQPNTTTSTYNLYFTWNTGSSNQYYGTTGIDYSGSNTGWHHLAVVRSGDDFSIFNDGQKLGSKTSSDTLPDVADSLRIGGAQISGSMYATYYLSGNIDELRISKGVARWEENFVPLERPYKP